MLGRKGLAERLEAELAAVTDLDAVPSACEAERVELARREAAGDIDSAAAARALAAVDRRENEARSAAAHRRRVASNLEAAVRAEEHRQELRRFDQLAKGCREAVEAERRRSRHVAGLLAALAEEVAALEADRAAVAAAVGRLRDAQPADVELPEVAFHEPERIDVDRHLAAFLEDQRRRAEGAKVARQAAINADGQERQMVRRAVEEDVATPRSMIPTLEDAFGNIRAVLPAVERLPEHLRDQARAEFERRLAERRERARPRDPQPERVWAREQVG